MNIYKEPWPHIVKEDFFSDVEELTRKTKDVIKERTPYGFHNKFTIKFPFNYNFPDLLPLLNYFPNRRNFSNLKTYWELNAIKGKYEYPIHDENPKKILSAVIYLDPINNLGTSLYDKDKKFCKDIPWKTNTAFIFAGVTGETWHNYACNTEEPRITINGFLHAD